ncbi:MAG: methyltransferase domain-containing protein [Flammeovirgaceae bacterium]|nr:MAG: methyltransferase domain-containing protein [Flammeovirgaceae bacterium]
MKNTEHWKPTKYELRNGRLRASRNPQFVSVSSRLMIDVTASFYQSALPEYARGSLADMGCGNVPFYMIYKNLVSEITCIDWPNTLHKNQYLDLECDLNKPLSLPDNQFDTIIISEVFEHIAEPEVLWSELARILKPNGKMLVSVPFLYKIHEAPHDYFRYTEFALKNYATKNNLHVLELRSFGGLPLVLTDLYAKMLVKIPLIGNALAAFIQSLCLWFIHTRLGKRLSANTGKAYPLGYFLVVEKRG